jgi:hypothetical protein
MLIYLLVMIAILVVVAVICLIYFAIGALRDHDKGHAIWQSSVALFLLTAAVCCCCGPIAWHYNNLRIKHAKYLETCLQEAQVKPSPASDYVTAKYFNCRRDTSPLDCLDESIKEVTSGPYAPQDVAAARKLLYVYVRHDYDDSDE